MLKGDHRWVAFFPTRKRYAPWFIIHSRGRLSTHKHSTILTQCSVDVTCACADYNNHDSHILFHLRGTFTTLIFNWILTDIDFMILNSYPYFQFLGKRWRYLIFFDNFVLQTFKHNIDVGTKMITMQWK